MISLESGDKEEDEPWVPFIVGVLSWFLVERLRERGRLLDDDVGGRFEFGFEES